MQLRDVFLAGNFVESLPTNSSRYVTQMYEQSREIEQAYASHRDALKRGDKERAAEIFEEEKDKISKHSLVTKNAKTLTDLNSRAKQIESDKVMSAERKRMELDLISQKRNKLALSLQGRI